LVTAPPRLIEISLGGKLCRCKQIQSLKPENALRSVDNSGFMVCRVGRLPFDATLWVKRAPSRTGGDHG